MDRKDAILYKAKKLFALKGYDATTMDEIAQIADVNKATIYYYFRSKEKLYEEALKLSIESVCIYIEDNTKGINDPKERLKVYIEAFYNHAKEDETFLRILMRELASSGEHFPMAVAKVFLKIVSILDEIIEEGVIKGVFVKRDPKIVHFIVLGAISCLTLSTPFRERLEQQVEDMPGFLRNSNNDVEELFGIILNGLERT